MDFTQIIQDILNALSGLGSGLVEELSIFLLDAVISYVQTPQGEAQLQQIIATIEGKGPTSAPASNIQSTEQNPEVQARIAQLAQQFRK